MGKDIRMAAAIRGDKKYRGGLCHKDENHGHQRYTSSGQCVQCVTNASKARVGRIRDALKAAVSA